MWLYVVICGFWLLSEIVINIFTRTKKPAGESHDNGTLGLIWVVIIVSITCGVLIGVNYREFNVFCYFLGFAFIIAGMIIRAIAIASLKSMFTPNVTIRNDHVLKTDGIYKRIRHPSYSGSLLSFLGLGLSLGNWISLAVIFIPVCAVFLYRINIEEQALVGNFGQDYLNYKKVTKRLIPFIY